MRAFAAITIPEEIRKLYSKLCRSMRETADMSVVRPDKMHITLAFFKDLDKNHIDKVREALQQVKPKSLEIRCCGLGKFSRRGIPSVIFVETQSEALSSFAKEFRNKLKEAGVPFDDKPFKPHLTVARIRNVSDLNIFERMYRRAKADFSEASFFADGVTLFSSDMISYKTIFKTELSVIHNDGHIDLEETL